MSRILVIEDDQLLNGGLCFNLQNAGYETMPVYDLKNAYPVVKSQKFDLMLLDVNLPDGNGFDFAMNESGEWQYVDGHGLSIFELKEPIVPETIIQEVEEQYQVTIERVASLSENLSEGYLLRDASGISYEYTGNEIRKLETSWSVNEKIHRYIRSHYPDDLEFEWVKTQNGIIIYRLADGTELCFDAQGDRVR